MRASPAGFEPAQARTDLHVSGGFAHDGTDANVQIATANCANARSTDVSLTKPASPRTALLVHLAEDLKAAIEAGDLEAARVAHEAIGRLLGSTAAKNATVVDLATARARRDGSDHP
jgi:hypothetical protein